ncbi:MAG: AsmA-like C-terminal region-containing protein, partial [Alphaproteobacteria bacterium]
ALWPLLGGEIQVESVTLVNPRILLETSEDGQANWDFTPEGTTAGGSDGGDFDMRLDNVRIEGGELRFLDAGTEVATLLSLEATVTAESLGGPFAADGSAQVNGLPFRFDAGIGAVAEAPQVALRVITEAGGGEASIDGRFADGGFDGTVALAAQDGKAFLAALGRAAGTEFDAPDMLAGSISLYTELTTSSEAISADQLALTLGESRLTGHARVVSQADTGGQAFDVALAGERLDVDAILEAMAAADGAAAPAEGTADGAGALPADLSGRLALAFDTVVLMGGEIASVDVEARLADGALAFERASMTLPGNAPLTLQGQISLEGGPRFVGSVDLSSSNPRALMSWAQVDLGSVPEGAMQSFAFSGALDASASAVRMDRFLLTLDESTAEGSLAAALTGTPSVTLNGNIDRIDLDRYLGSGEAGGGEASGSGGNPLAGFGADVNLTFGALTIGGNAYSPVTAVGSVRDGALTIDQLTGIGPGGSAFRISGTVADPVALQFALSFDVSHPNLQRLLTAFGLDAAGAPAVSVAVAGTAESDGTRLTISDLRGSLGDSDIAGTVTAALGDPIEASAQLQSNLLNLDAILPGGSGGTGGGERWSREPLDLAALRGINGDITWTIGRLVMAPNGLDNAELLARLADGVLTISSLTGSMGGGTVQISAEINASDRPSIALSMAGRGVTFEPGVLSIGGVSLDGARVDLSLDVAGAGVSMAELVGGLNGTAALSVGGGVINGLDLGAWRDTLNGLGGDLSSLSGVLGTLGGGFQQGVLGGQTPIGSLTGTFQIQNGEVYSDDLALVSDVATVELDGAVSLPAWTLSALGAAVVQQSIFDEVPAIPFGLGGSLDNPSFMPDFTALQLFLGTDVMGLSLDQLPADVLAGLGINGLSPDMLQGVDPQQLIQGLLSGSQGVGPDVFQRLLQQGGDGGEAMAPAPDALLQQLLGGTVAGGETADAPADPAAALQRLLGGDLTATPDSPVTPEEVRPEDAADAPEAAPEPEAEPELAAETEPEAAPEPGAEPELGAETELEAETALEAEPELVTEPELETELEPVTGQLPEPEAETLGEEPTAEPAEEPVSAPDTQPAAEEQPAEESAPESEPAAEPTPEASPAPDETAAEQPADAVEPDESGTPTADGSEPAADVPSESEPAEPVATETDAGEPAAEQPADPGESEPVSPASDEDPAEPTTDEAVPAADQTQPTGDQPAEVEDCDPETEEECPVLEEDPTQPAGESQ